MKLKIAIICFICILLVLVLYVLTLKKEYFASNKNWL